MKSQITHSQVWMKWHFKFILKKKKKKIKPLCRPSPKETLKDKPIEDRELNVSSVNSF